VQSQISLVKQHFFMAQQEGCCRYREARMALQKYCMPTRLHQHGDSPDSQHHLRCQSTCSCFCTEHCSTQTDIGTHHQCEDGWHRRRRLRRRQLRHRRRHQRRRWCPGPRLRRRPAGRRRRGPRCPPCGPPRWSAPWCPGPAPPGKLNMGAMTQQCDNNSRGSIAITWGRLDCLLSSDAA
jgi:hypothetical protein